MDSDLDFSENYSDGSLVQGYEPYALDFMFKIEKLYESDIIFERKEVPKIYWYDDKNKNIDILWIFLYHLKIV